MPRYLCVYFTSTRNAEVNRKNKKVKVVTAEVSRDVVPILIQEYNATYIKSVRDLEHPRYYIYDKALHDLEQSNNLKLEYE